MVVVGTGMKWCWRCDQVKPLSGFRLTRPGGTYRGRCNACEWADRRRKTSVAAALREAEGRVGVPDGSKRCLSCGIVKILAMFPNRNGPGSTKRNQCRSCIKKRNVDSLANPRPRVPAYLPTIDEIEERARAIRARTEVPKVVIPEGAEIILKAIQDYRRARRSIRELIRPVQ